MIILNEDNLTIKQLWPYVNIFIYYVYFQKHFQKICKTSFIYLMPLLKCSIWEYTVYLCYKTINIDVFTCEFMATFHLNIAVVLCTKAYFNLVSNTLLSQ